MSVFHIDNPATLKGFKKGGVYALGDFDGVHNGHRAILEATRKLAHKLQVDNWGVILFTPNTKLWFKDKFKNYEILTTDEQKINLLKGLNIPSIVVIDFSKSFNLTSKEFFKQYLVDKIGIQGLITGKGTRFGSDLLLVKSTVKNYNHEINQNSKIEASNSTIVYSEANLLGGPEGKLYSSSLIKEYLRAGNIELVNKYLGHNFKIDATVIHGNKLGRTLGFPTANFIINSYAKPKHGIYATRITLKDNKVYDSVSSFGVRPTIASTNYEEILEVNIFDFKGDLYGQKLSVEFIEYLRPELKFNNLEDLKQQIHLDCINAKKILNKLNKV